MIQHNCTRWNLGVFGEITPSTSELVSAHSITHIYTHTYTHARTCAYLIIYTLKRKDFIKGDLNMKKKEINEIMAHVAALSDEKFEEEYYTAVDNCLGSQVDTMIERGYDSVDIIEREKHEKYLSEYADMLGYLCEKRNIKLWGDK